MKVRKKEELALDSSLTLFYCLILAVSDLDVKGLNKRASGQSFEVILKDPDQDKAQPQLLPLHPRREVSLEEFQKRLEAAEERRKVSRYYTSLQHGLILEHFW